MRWYSLAHSRLVDRRKYGDRKEITGGSASSACGLGYKLMSPRTIKTYTQITNV